MVNRSERLSALMDAELDAAQEQELIRSWDQEDTARCWNEYHLIGDVLREQEIRHVCLTQRISEALKAEPVVLAPKPWRRAAPVPTRWLAVAATVAAVSLTTWHLQQPASVALTNGVQSATMASLVPASNPVSGATVLAQEGARPLPSNVAESLVKPTQEVHPRELSTMASTTRTRPVISPEPAPEVATQLASQAAEPYVAWHRQWSTLSGFQTVDYETGPTSGR